MLGHIVGHAAELPITYFCNKLTVNKAICPAIAYMSHEFFIEPLTDSIIYTSIQNLNFIANPYNMGLALIDNIKNANPYEIVISIPYNIGLALVANIRNADPYKIGISIAGSYLSITALKKTNIENKWIEALVSVTASYIGGELYDRYIDKTGEINSGADNLEI